MQNLDALISAHNKGKIRREREKDEQDNIKSCNCRKSSTCPVGNQCLTRSVVYEATIHHGKTQVKYVGMTENDLKTRYNRHLLTTRHERYRTETELSSYVWKLKDKKTDYNITWRILKRAQPYRGGAITCNLCLAEKYFILVGQNLINKKSELLNKCRHRRKYLLNALPD